MSTTFFILTTVSMLGVLGVLIVGVFGMAKGGDFNKKYANTLMRARVLLQGATLVFFALMVLTLKK